MLRRILRVTRKSCAHFDRLTCLAPILDLHALRSPADAQRRRRLNAVALELLERAEDHLLLDVRQWLAREALGGGGRAAADLEPRLDRLRLDHAGSRF